MTPVIDIRDLHVRFGEVEAVAGINLAADSGRATALLGRNGAGKSTTMKVLAGVVPPTSGTVLVAGHDVAADPLAVKRAVGYCPDVGGLVPRATPWEHLQLTARLRRMPEWEARGRDLLERFELGDVAHRVVGGFSHGMSRRLSVVLAALHEPGGPAARRALRRRRPDRRRGHPRGRRRRARPRRLHPALHPPARPRPRGLRLGDRAARRLQRRRDGRRRADQRGLPCAPRLRPGAWRRGRPPTCATCCASAPRLYGDRGPPPLAVIAVLVAVTIVLAVGPAWASGLPADRRQQIEDLLPAALAASCCSASAPRWAAAAAASCCRESRR